MYYSSEHTFKSKKYTVITKSLRVFRIILNSSVFGKYYYEEPNVLTEPFKYMKCRWKATNWNLPVIK